MGLQPFTIKTLLTFIVLILIYAIIIYLPLTGNMYVDVIVKVAPCYSQVTIPWPPLTIVLILVDLLGRGPNAHPRLNATLQKNKNSFFEWQNRFLP